MARFFTLPALAFLLAFSLPQTVRADYGGGNQSMSGGGASAGLSKATTRKVIRFLTRDFERCTRLDKVYRYDCYRFTYKLAADQMVGNSAYADAFKAVKLVQDRLTQIVDENRDTTKPPVRRGLQQFKAIKPEAVPRSKQQLTQALDEAETILLRSASQSGNVHFARIAEAVGTNKVLLRSLLRTLERLISGFA